MIHEGPAKWCSFCARSSKAPEVKRMIASANDKHICNICVTQGAALIKQDKDTGYGKVIKFRKRA